MRAWAGRTRIHGGELIGARPSWSGETRASVHRAAAGAGRDLRPARPDAGSPGLLAPLLALREPPSRLALLTGAVIASYSLLDKVGLRYVAPGLYIYLLFGVSAVSLAPLMLTRKRAALRKEWRVNRASVMTTAALFMAASLLVMFALRGAQVSYVVAVRGVGVVFAVMLGTALLREPFARMKLCGSLLIFVGIACIQLAG